MVKEISVCLGISGSGVFGRYPDAIMVFNRNDEGNGKAWFTLRSFKTPEPLLIKFEYPLFRIRQDKPLSKGRKPKVSDEDFKAYVEANPDAEPSDIMKYFGISMWSMRN